MIKEYISLRNFIPILKKGPLRAIVKGGEKNLEKAVSEIDFLRDQFFPQSAEPELIKEFGRSRGIVQWPVETMEEYEIRVFMAYTFWKKGENPAGLKEIINAFGYKDTKINEHHDYSFSLELKLGESIPQTGFLLKLLNEVKPARSILNEVITKTDLSSSLYLGSPESKVAINNDISPDFNLKIKTPFKIFQGVKTQSVSLINKNITRDKSSIKLDAGFKCKNDIYSKVDFSKVHTKASVKLNNGINIKVMTIV